MEATTDFDNAFFLYQFFPKIHLGGTNAMN